MLTCLLGFLTYTAYSKGLQIHKKEKAAEAASQSNKVEGDGDADPNSLLKKENRPLSVNAEEGEIVDEDGTTEDPDENSNLTAIEVNGKKLYLG